MRQAPLIVDQRAPDYIRDFARNVERWAQNLIRGPYVLTSYTVSTLPAASDWVAGLIYVSNETGGAVPAFSDGTNWRRCTDRVIVS